MTGLAVSDMMRGNAGVGGIQSAGVRICFNGLIALSLPFVEPCSVVLSRKMMKKDSKYCIFENLFLYLWNEYMYEQTYIIQT